MGYKQAKICVCNQCGYEWLPRKSNPDPVSCANCKSPLWNRPKRDKK